MEEKSEKSGMIFNRVSKTNFQTSWQELPFTKPSALWWIPMPSIAFPSRSSGVSSIMRTAGFPWVCSATQCWFFSADPGFSLDNLRGTDGGCRFSLLQNVEQFLEWTEIWWARLSRPDKPRSAFTAACLRFPGTSSEKTKFPAWFPCPPPCHLAVYIGKGEAPSEGQRFERFHREQKPKQEDVHAHSPTARFQRTLQFLQREFQQNSHHPALNGVPQPWNAFESRFTSFKAARNPLLPSDCAGTLFSGLLDASWNPPRCHAERLGPISPGYVVGMLRSPQQLCNRRRAIRHHADDGGRRHGGGKHGGGVKQGSSARNDLLSPVRLWVNHRTDAQSSLGTGRRSKQKLRPYIGEKWASGESLWVVWKSRDSSVLRMQRSDMLFMPSKARLWIRNVYSFGEFSASRCLRLHRMNFYKICQTQEYYHLLDKHRYAVAYHLRNPQEDNTYPYSAFYKTWAVSPQNIYVQLQNDQVYSYNTSS